MNSQSCPVCLSPSVTTLLDAPENRRAATHPALSSSVSGEQVLLYPRVPVEAVRPRRLRRRASPVTAGLGGSVATGSASRFAVLLNEQVVASEGVALPTDVPQGFARATPTQTRPPVIQLGLEVKVRDFETPAVEATVATVAKPGTGGLVMTDVVDGHIVRDLAAQLRPHEAVNLPALPVNHYVPVASDVGAERPKQASVFGSSSYGQDLIKGKRYASHVAILTYWGDNDACT